MKIVTAEQIRELDQLTVDLTGVSWATLMETAGARIAESIISDASRDVIAVFCGKGNNGGDGAVVARHLWLRGAVVDVFLFGRIGDTRGEARTNLEILKRLSDANATSNGGEVNFIEITSEAEASEIRILHDAVIDALLGTGLQRPAAGLYAKAIETINQGKALLGEALLVLSVDIPSGISSDSAQISGPCVNADVTVTFTAPKVGNVLPPACNFNGKLVTVSIGTPDELIDEIDSDTFLVEADDATGWLDTSRRVADAHKGSVGDVLLIAGSPGKTGAAALAAEAILKCGAGLVTVATSRSARSMLISQAPSVVMTEALEELPNGAISSKALNRALELSTGRTVVAIGPGLSSQDDSTREFVREFVRRRTVPLVIDADGLNALAPLPDNLHFGNHGPVVVTPHPGEMARLTGRTTAEVLADRVNIARAFSQKHGVTTVLKGQRSLVVSPEGQICVNPTGNAGMATAGSGDVLTGIIAGLLAQSEKAGFEAIVTAVYLHGLAGDLAAREVGIRSLVASDITRFLPAAIIEIGGKAEHPA